jgi:threonine/homoserine/homoserine lactone efflux protein
MRGKLGNTFGMIRASFLSEAESEGENAMAASSVAAFWVVALLLIVVPGADWAFVIGTVLGGRPVLPAVGGLVLGYAGLTIVVAAGVGAVVARSPAALTALTVAGGLYLIWLGARSLGRPGGHGVAAGAETGAGRSALVRGVGVSGLNPKGLLVYLAVLPQFTTPRGSWPLTAQLGVLGLVFVLTCGAFYLSLGSVARQVLESRPGTARAITRFSGAAMVVIGLLLLAERLLT